MLELFDSLFGGVFNNSHFADAEKVNYLALGELQLRLFEHYFYIINIDGTVDFLHTLPVPCNPRVVGHDFLHIFHIGRVKVIDFVHIEHRLILLEKFHFVLPRRQELIRDEFGEHLGDSVAEILAGGVELMRDSDQDLYKLVPDQFFGRVLLIRRLIKVHCRKEHFQCVAENVFFVADARLGHELQKLSIVHCRPVTLGRVKNENVFDLLHPLLNNLFNLHHLKFTFDELMQLPLLLIVLEAHLVCRRGVFLEPVED